MRSESKVTVRNVDSLQSLAMDREHMLFLQGVDSSYLPTLIILDSELNWLYLSWDSNQKKLEVNQKHGVHMKEMLSILGTVVNLVKETDMIHSFNALQTLPKVQAERAEMVVPWRMELSLRHPRSSDLHAHLCKLA